MYSQDQLETAPVRRRIIQQQLRTEPACALIAADAAQTAELEALLKRDRPLITFPSISHFLAEPVRREPWAAVVIARAGAWDPRFDSYVRRRRSIALYAFAEEVYGWPETVARVRGVTELTAWLEALNAPEPTYAKAAEKRERRAQAKAAALSELSANRLKQSARTVATDEQPRAEASAAPASVITVKDVSRPVTAAPSKAKAKPRSQPVQLELASAEPESDLSSLGRGPRVAAKQPKSALRKKRTTLTRTPERATARSTPQEPVERPRKRITSRFSESTAQSEAADRTFMLLAAEIGLTRAAVLLDALRKRAAGLTRA